MPTKTNKPLIVLACVLAVLLLAGVAYFIYMHFWGTPKPTFVSTYVCPDKSFYIVVQKEGSIQIAGDTFTQVDGSSRFSNGAYEIALTPESFTLSNVATGEAISSCVADVPDTGAPAVRN